MYYSKYEESQSEENISNVAVVPFISDTKSGFSRMKAVKNYRKTLNYIKTSLSLKDDQIKKIKLKDIPKKLSEAKDQITVEKMDILIAQEKLSIGDTINNFFCKLKRNCGC